MSALPLTIGLNRAVKQGLGIGPRISYSLREGCARRSLETLMAYQVQQGILEKMPEIENLFFPEGLDL
jgi:hypothetical protein